MDQGSEIMPLAWARALVLADGTPFLGGALSRYGYLPNPDTAELPIGFTAARRGGTDYLGMTCAACHTREIEVDGQAYRVEGQVTLGAVQEGRQTIQIDWRVKDGRGNAVGTVTQKNAIPPGSLDGSWGQTADAAAAAAAQGILKLLPQQAH